MLSLEEIKTVIGDVLQIPDRMVSMDENSGLLGAIPEFDSMAVVSILTTIEENYGLIINDDEVTAEIFETVGSLLDFINSISD